MEEHPEVTVASTTVRRTGETGVEVTRNLTVRGVTRSVMIPFEYGGTATDPHGNVRIGFEGRVAIHRKDYGITWNADLETGGVLVGDKILLEFDISAVRAT